MPIETNTVLIDQKDIYIYKYIYSVLYYRCRCNGSEVVILLMCVISAQIIVSLLHVDRYTR